MSDDFIPEPVAVRLEKKTGEILGKLGDVETLIEERIKIERERMELKRQLDDGQRRAARHRVIALVLTLVVLAGALLWRMDAKVHCLQKRQSNNAAAAAPRSDSMARLVLEFADLFKIAQDKTKTEAERQKEINDRVTEIGKKDGTADAFREADKQYRATRDNNRVSSC